MPTISPSAWMPLYWGDYLRDTGHLDATQHGFYLLLIGHYWTTGKPLPDDDAKLWRIARADSLDHWKAHRESIAEFFSVGDGEWRHARIAEELELAVEKRTAAKDRAEKAARTRWERERQSGKNAQSTHKECPPSPSPAVSVPNGTGGDLAAVVFRDGLAWMTAKTGQSESNCRKQLGKWRGLIGDAALIEVLGAAQREGPIDAMAWLEKAVASRTGGKPRKPWEKPPADALPPEEPWAKRMADYHKDGFWNEASMGPRPGQPGCRVPPQFRSAA